MSPFLFAAPSSTAAEQVGNFSIAHRGAIQYVRPSEDEDEDRPFDTAYVTANMSGHDALELRNRAATVKSYLGDARFPAFVSERDFDWNAQTWSHIGVIDQALTVEYDLSSLATADLSTFVARGTRQIVSSIAKLQNELLGYDNLHDDWDDSGAARPSPNAVEIARAFLEFGRTVGAIPKRTYVSPGGEVGLVWSRGSGYADLSFLGDGTVSYYVRSADGTQEEFSEQRIPLLELKPEFWSLLRTL